MPYYTIYILYIVYTFLCRVKETEVGKRDSRHCQYDIFELTEPVVNRSCVSSQEFVLHPLYQTHFFAIDETFDDLREQLKVSTPRLPDYMFLSLSLLHLKTRFFFVMCAAVILPDCIFSQVNIYRGLYKYIRIKWINNCAFFRRRRAAHSFLSLARI